MKRTIIALSIALALVSSAGAAVAQYPQPTGNLTLTSAAVSSPVGSDVLLTCALLDASGAPIGNAPCTFTIESEPGDDAAVGSKVVTRTTDASGVAVTTLKTGSTPGQVIVSATSGSFRSVIVVSVAGATGLPPAASLLRPPSTGDGGLVR